MSGEEVLDLIDTTKEKNQERDLQSLFEQTMAHGEVQKATLMAVVVDITEVFKIESQDKQAIKLKIIDRSFNYTQSQSKKYKKMQKFATVILLADYLEGLPKFQYIGNIIVLRRFKFKSNSEGELYGIENYYSNWLVVDQNDGEVLQSRNKKTYVGKDGNQKQVSEIKGEQTRTSLYPTEHLLCTALREWTRDFFKNNCIKNVLWWNHVIEPNDLEIAHKSELKQENVDLILRLEKVEKKQAKNEFFDEMNFYDENNNLYILKVPQSVTKKDEIIKLRCVNIIFSKKDQINVRFIKFNLNSTSMKVPSDFYNYQLFFSKNIQQVQTRKYRCKGLNTKRKIMEIYPFLEKYYFEDILINQDEIILNPQWNFNHINQNTMIVKEYENYQPVKLNLFRNSKINELNEQLYQKFVIEVAIEDIDFTESSISLVCKGKQRHIYPFQEFIQECCGDNLEIFVHFKIKVSDDSLDNEEPIPIQIVMNKENQDFFQLWKILPDLNDVKKWATNNEIMYSKFNNKFKLLSKSSSKIKLVCELKRSSYHRKVFFLQLCDTVFTP